MRYCLLSTAWFLLVTIPAHADWHYTKWGMTPAQIIKASKGEAREYVPGRNIGCVFTDQTPIAVATGKTIAGSLFDVTFCSGGNGRLSSVAVRPQGSINIPSLKRAMLSQYGEPVSDRGGTTIWRDAKAKNTVTFSTVSDIIVAIEYRALGGGGL
ncbi:MAG: hypothetical protein K9G60_01910 [Pseudolabrys sp.]|nr:hypothetical protein [Pseudolabrys sp.]